MEVVQITSFRFLTKSLANLENLFRKLCLLMFGHFRIKTNLLGRFENKSIQFFT